MKPNSLSETRLRSRMYESNHRSLDAHWDSCELCRNRNILDPLCPVGTRLLRQAADAAQLCRQAIVDRRAVA
jgi:hypothetical protein